MAAPIDKGAAPFFSSGIRSKHLVFASTAAAVTLKNSQSGCTFLFDRASGVSYTLPLVGSKVGTWFRFFVSVLQTSGTNKISCRFGDRGFSGSVITFSGNDVTPSDTLGPKMFLADVGTDDNTFSTNGTTTGGGIGSWIEVHAIPAVNAAWAVTGVIKSPSGIIATPFSSV